MTAVNSLESVKLELVTMLKMGYTLNGIKRHLTNNGCNEELANTLVRVAELNNN